MNVNMVAFPVSLLNNGTRTFGAVPTSGGGFTVLGAYVTNNVDGTAQLALCTFGTAGTAAVGTIVTFGSVLGAGTALAGTLVTPYVGPGTIIGVKELNKGTFGTVATCTVAYVMGK